MAINVAQQQLSGLAADIDNAVSSSRSREISIADASAQTFGDEALALWVTAGKDGLQASVRALAHDAGAAAGGVRGSLADFTTTDAGVSSSFAGQGGASAV